MLLYTVFCNISTHFSVNSSRERIFAFNDLRPKHFGRQRAGFASQLITNWQHEIFLKGNAYTELSQGIQLHGNWEKNKLVSLVRIMQGTKGAWLAKKKKNN